MGGRRVAVAAAALLFGGGLMAFAGGYDHLDEVLAGRHSEVTTLSALNECEKAFRAAPADPGVSERLVRVRYYLANRYRREEQALAEQRRGIRDGLAGLSRVLGKELATIDGLDEKARFVPTRSVGTLYWTTLCYGNTIESLSIFYRMSAAKRFSRLLRAALKLDETYFHGGPHRVLAEYLNQAPGIAGGDAKEARTHAERAVAIGPRFAENHVVFAEVVAVQDRDEKAYRAALERALALADDALADCVPEQHQAKERARAALAKTDEIFH